MFANDAKFDGILAEKNQRHPKAGAQKNHEREEATSCSHDIVFFYVWLVLLSQLLEQVYEYYVSYEFL